MFRVFASLIALLTSFSAPVSFAAEFDSAAAVREISPHLDDRTLAVVQIDLARLELKPLVEIWLDMVQRDEPYPENLRAMMNELETAGAGLQKAGVGRAYMVVNWRDVPFSRFTGPYYVFPVVETGDAQAAKEVLVNWFRETRVNAGAVLCAERASTLDRIETKRPFQDDNLRKAFEAAGDATIRIAVVPGDDDRRAFAEMLPEIPKEFGGGSGRLVADGIQWAAVGVKFPPQASMRVVVQSKSSEVAEALLGFLTNLRDFVGRIDAVQRRFPIYDDSARLLTPRVEKDRLVRELTDDDVGLKAVSRLLARGVERAWLARYRERATRNLKQLGLAMHNHHSRHGNIPAAASYNKDGKRLLSWRVRLLPFLDQGELYKEFHLDEPWDSKHNVKLLDRMPDVFSNGDRIQKRKGLTTYLVPVGKEGDPKRETMFTGKKGVTVREVTDGTTNTIMVVDVAPSAAVPWTRPADFVVDWEEPQTNLFAPLADSTHALFGDGSVHTLPKSMEAETLRVLFTHAGGEPTPGF